MENGIFGSEIGSGFGDACGTPPPKIPRSTPLGQAFLRDSDPGGHAGLQEK